jgi:hypothetical protein|tara:strand:+ start:260 stop:604 length:345 start_codon:yes stop_codon:yes gene_type:complete
MVYESQPTGIAMCQHVHGGSPLEFGNIPKKIKTVLANGSTGRDVFIGNLYSSGANSRYLAGDIRNLGSNLSTGIHAQDKFTAVGRVIRRTSANRLKAGEKSAVAAASHAANHMP